MSDLQAKYTQLLEVHDNLKLLFEKLISASESVLVVYQDINPNNGVSLTQVQTLHTTMKHLHKVTNEWPVDTSEKFKADIVSAIVRLNDTHQTITIENINKVLYEQN